jgi:hypothetical protein
MATALFVCLHDAGPSTSRTGRVEALVAELDGAA